MLKLDPSKLRKTVYERQAETNQTQIDIAKDAIMSPERLSTLMNEKELTNVTNRTIYMLCKALDCRAKELIEDE